MPYTCYATVTQVGCTPYSAQVQCINAGGTWTNNVCQFNRNSCPTNWMFAEWITTASNTCTGQSITDDYGVICTGNSCTTIPSPWNQSSLSSIPTCNYTGTYLSNPAPGPCPGGYCESCYIQTSTCYSTITQIGCLPSA